MTDENFTVDNNFFGTVLQSGEDILQIRSVTLRREIENVKIITDRNIVLYTVDVLNKTKDIIVDTVSVHVPKNIKVVGGVKTPLLPQESAPLNLEVDTSVNFHGRVVIIPGIVNIQED